LKEHSPENSKIIDDKSTSSYYQRRIRHLRNITPSSHLSPEALTGNSGKLSRKNNDLPQAKVAELEPLKRKSYSPMRRAQKKNGQLKKIVMEPDEGTDITELKDIDPLLILSHQNIKPTKYILNTKDLGDKLTDHDKKFLAPRLPNLFKKSTAPKESNLVNLTDPVPKRKENRGDTIIIVGQENATNVEMASPEVTSSKGKKPQS
jgi:hypothetical protein